MSRFNGKRAEFEASGEKINVAILGAGRIAHTMAGTLTQMAEDSLYSSWIHPYAVADRKKHTSELQSPNASRMPSSA